MQKFSRWMVRGVCSSILLSAPVAGGTLPEPFQVIPSPQQVDLSTGRGLANGDLNAVLLDTGVSRPVMQPILDRLPQTSHFGAGVLRLRVMSGTDVPESPEGYVLVIADGHAEISARGDAGVFYGCQTLGQLLEDARDTGTPVPACRITDTPALSYRAVHFDVKHHLDHMNYYYDAIDRLARYKLNAVIFEFEDKLRYRRQPLVGASDAISIEEMAALTSYARARHIEISPLVQGLGHATFILKHEVYAGLRENPKNRWAFCPLNEGTYQVLFDLYRDAIDATPGSRYVHIGGDEIGNIGQCPRCRPMAEKEGMFKLNLYWLNRVSEFIVSQGRTPIFWDDMPLKYAGVNESASSQSDLNEAQAKALWEKGEPVLDGLVDQYPKQCVFMRWNYSMARQPGNIMALDWYRRRGVQTMIATAIQSGPATLIPFDESGQHITDRGVVAARSFIRLAAEKHIDGMLCTAWDDRSPHMETYWRGFIASAEYSWSPEARSLREFDAAYFQREYGPGTGRFAGLFHRLRQGVAFWERAFNRTGNRMDYENAMIDLPGIAHWIEKPSDAPSQTRADYERKLIGLPDPSAPGTWTRENQQRLQTAREETQAYKSLARDIAVLQRTSIRNRYHWELMGAINDFQVTAPHLLLALQACDVGDRGRRTAGLERVRTALAEFDGAWAALQRVYAKTRFLSNPPDYVPDRYFHFASQREDLSYLIQVEDLYHDMIGQWLKRE